MRQRRGFTLIEIMLVVIILGILAAMVVPRLTGRSDEARRQVAKTDIESNLALAIDLYEVDMGGYPDNLEELQRAPSGAPNWKGPYLKKKPIDPWGRPYVYKHPGTHNAEGYDLYSLGKDGVEGGNDNIANWNERSKKLRGFTLVELLVAVAVIAVGMVFVIGAFSQCLSALTTAHRMVAAEYLLNGRIWESDLAIKLENGSEVGNWSGVFLQPYENFNWTQQIQPVSGDFGLQTSSIEELLNQETTKIIWHQGRQNKDISITRFVKKKRN